MKVYQAIAQTRIAHLNCIGSGNVKWIEKHSEKLNYLIENYLPTGSGWDEGTHISWDENPKKKLVFYGGFHHMDENGFYDRWTNHSIIVTPDWDGFSLKITGQNHNDIKEYLADLFYNALNQEVK